MLVKSITLIVASALLLPAAVSAAGTGGVPHLDFRDFALQECLNGNYEKAGLYQRRSLQDYSHPKPRYSPSDWLKLIDFVENKTGDFHRKRISIHSEESGDTEMNMIFARCMAFYHSKELTDFLRKNRY
ncbi:MULTISPECIES: hypothetical protein [unclassified Neisseria]|uniref:hypothetical protein n=1 Tax=unclassified Neisseria TaxID=2623750 RepID=UPI002666DE4B|nr:MULTISPECIES: hypothetical protein [unclassified Neisseria]MDO1509895.1 hypothetical protein [Neisseria sp. MVDL19-042950]MDO1516094.1 hypothetical protein [Neisseria sp. MVDL18-041461]MDO1563209.1 hypothetical protein [Neisseria sp. MVDL20-010259]